MFKRVCVVAAGAAVGLRAQVSHLRDGVLVQGSVEDPAAVAAALNTALGSDELRDACAVNGQARVVSSGLVYDQISHWIDVIGTYFARRERDAQLAFSGDEAGNAAAACAPPRQRAGGGVSGWPASTAW